MTTISLKDYIEKRFELSESAARTALAAMDKRLEGMNEFRGAIEDQAKHFISRVEHDALCKRIEVLEQNRARIEGRASTSLIIALAGVIVALISLARDLFVR